MLIYTKSKLPTNNKSKEFVFISPTQKSGGGERDRTDDLHGASVTLSQLSYTPKKFGAVRV